MADAATALSIAALWPVRAISHAEKDWLRKRIRFILFSQQDHFNAYLEYCQRILLYLEYVKNEPGITYSDPIDWIQPGNGYSVARVLYKEVQVMRLRNRTFRKELKWVAEAALEITEGVDDARAYWEKWFVDHRCPEGLRMLYLFIAFSIK